MLGGPCASLPQARLLHCLPPFPATGSRAGSLDPLLPIPIPLLLPLFPPPFGAFFFPPRRVSHSDGEAQRGLPGAAAIGRGGLGRRSLPLLETCPPALPGSSPALLPPTLLQAAEAGAAAPHGREQAGPARPRPQLPPARRLQSCSSRSRLGDAAGPGLPGTGRRGEDVALQDQLTRPPVLGARRRSAPGQASARSARLEREPGRGRDLNSGLVGQLGGLDGRVGIAEAKEGLGWSQVI